MRHLSRQWKCKNRSDVSRVSLDEHDGSYKYESMKNCLEKLLTMNVSMNKV